VALSSSLQHRISESWRILFFVPSDSEWVIVLRRAPATSAVVDIRSVDAVLKVAAAVLVSLIVVFLVIIALILKSIYVVVVPKDFLLLEVLVILRISIFLILVLLELLILKVVALPLLLLFVQVGHVLVQIVLFG